MAGVLFPRSAVGLPSRSTCVEGRGSLQADSLTDWLLQDNVEHRHPAPGDTAQRHGPQASVGVSRLD